MNELHDSQMEYLARKDPKQIVESLFYIVDKSGKQVPFIFNIPQNIYYENRSARDDILKARKEGFSSAILGILTAKFLFVPNTVNMCVSHREEDTKGLLEKVRYYIEHLPFHVELEMAASNRFRIKEMNTDFLIATAGSKTAGRGGTPHNLHLSEFAFYPSWDMVTGLTNAVPDDLENTWIVKETTANGYGNPHHMAWQDEKKGYSVYKPHFFSWRDSPEYKMDITSVTSFDDVERDLQELHKLTDEQLHWRQWKIKSMQPTQDYSKEDLFKQEFPLTDTEAFLSTGRPFFDPVTLDWYEQAMCKEPIRKGYLTGFKPPVLTEDKLGALRIYVEPKPNKRYVIGGDTASGEGSDYSALVVLDRDSMETVALWWGKADEFEMAHVAYRLGTYYNTALIGIERNNMGIGVVMKLDELGYTKQYRMEELDEMGHRTKNKLGWETNSKTRPLVLTKLLEVVNQRQILIRSLDIISEARSMVRVREGHPEAQQGTHDDLIMALAIAVHMYGTIPSGDLTDEVVIRNYRPNTTISNFLPKKNESNRRFGVPLGRNF